MTDLEKQLFENQDLDYRSFNQGLIPTAPLEHFIGVRTPVLRDIAKDYSKNPEHKAFMNNLPHKYFEENQIHGFLIEHIKDYNELVKELNRFLPYVDNWATCDQMKAKCIKKHKDEFLVEIKRWLKSNHTYTIRYAVEALMNFYLGDDDSNELLLIPSTIKSDEYYVNMMIAWYYATALAKKWDVTIKIIESKVLPAWVQNKTISKARDSFRITNEQKEYLATLRIK